MTQFKTYNRFVVLRMRYRPINNTAGKQLLPSIKMQDSRSKWLLSKNCVTRSRVNFPLNLEIRWALQDSAPTTSQRLKRRKKQTSSRQWGVVTLIRSLIPLRWARRKRVVIITIALIKILEWISETSPSWVFSIIVASDFLLPDWVTWMEEKLAWSKEAQVPPWNNLRHPWFSDKLSQEVLLSTHLVPWTWMKKMVLVVETHKAMTTTSAPVDNIPVTIRPSQQLSHSAKSLLKISCLAIFQARPNINRWAFRSIKWSKSCKNWLNIKIWCQARQEENSQVPSITFSEPSAMTRWKIITVAEVNSITRSWIISTSNNIASSWWTLNT